MFPPGLGGRPPHVTTEAHFLPWFDDVMNRLLNLCDFVVAGERYHFAELEAYYSGDAHPDLFAHRDPLQLENARWYFHRTRGEYRGGSFKGLDLTMGDGKAFFGILIRTIVLDDESLIDGPSLTVDYLLSATKAKNVAALDGMIAGRSIWDTTSPLHIAEATEPRSATVHRTARVGLSLKKAAGKADAPKFVMRPYRYLTQPRGISKGKVHLVIALHQRGETTHAIHLLTGCPKKTIERYVADFAAGKAIAAFDGYIGKDLGTADLCKLHGTWSVAHGSAT
ncbi:MAG TPA: hypothetical protein VMZ71_17600 [Gemmataceae bacterium]|nr:hypothetical protein [Gemmataceae bacterium]